MSILRAARRLRKAQDITYRVTVEHIEDLKIIEQFPEVVSDVLEDIEAKIAILRQQSQLVTVYKDREVERNEIMVGVTQELANLSTIWGGEGQNLKILTHSDPVYVRSVLVESTDEAFISAIQNMSEDERLLFEAKLTRAGVTSP